LLGLVTSGATRLVTSSRVATEDTRAKAQQGWVDAQCQVIRQITWNGSQPPCLG
ncbi:hypothetical protein P7K49_020334, partial [Saguinus oedipus]